MRPLKTRVLIMLDKLPDNTMIALALAILTSAVRVVYDHEEAKPIRIALEAILCGCLSFAASFAIAAMGLDMAWAVFSGGVIGFLGADFIRFIARRYVKRGF